MFPKPVKAEKKPRKALKRSAIKRSVPDRRVPRVPITRVRATKRTKKNLFPKKKSEIRKGKLGTLRLRGKALENLRILVFVRAGGQVGPGECYFGTESKLETCKVGHCEVMHPQGRVSVRCNKPITWEDFHLMHIRGRGAGGADTMENTLAACAEDHIKSHNCGGKPIKVSKQEGNQ